MASNSTALPPIPSDIAALTAPQLIGTLFNWMFFGVLSVQTYIYYFNFPGDTIRNKILVYGVYIFETVQTAMTAADLYFWFSSGFGNMLHLGNINISPADTPLLSGIIAAVVQCFFAYRIFALRRSYLAICIVIVLTSAVQTAGAIGSTIRGFKLQEYARFHEDIVFPQLIYVWLIGDVVCDILIAGTMLWLFHASGKDNIQHGSNLILGRLVRLIMETNTLTAAMAVISFICFAALPNNNLFVCTTLIMGKLYSNTLLVTFNNRIVLRNDLNKGSSYDSRGSSRVPVPARYPNDFNAQELSTFRVPTESFGVHSHGAEACDIEPGTAKQRPL